MISGKDKERVCRKCGKDSTVLITRGEDKLIFCDCGAVTAVKGKEELVVYDFKNT